MRNNILRKPLLRTSRPVVLPAGFVDVVIGLFLLPAAVRSAVAGPGLFREESGPKA
ncbi:MAG: hypothetical protein V3R36_03055 [Dehalococcoidales bacterium]